MCEQAAAGQCPASCGECPHEVWIRRWIEREEREVQKERRREELLQAVKANVISWAVIGAIGYGALLAWDGFAAHMKSIFGAKT